MHIVKPFLHKLSREVQTAPACYRATEPRDVQTPNFLPDKYPMNTSWQDILEPRKNTPKTPKEYLGANKSTQTFFAQSFSTTLRVMDVRAENRGRPHRKVRFPAAPVVGRMFMLFC